MNDLQTAMENAIARIWEAIQSAELADIPTLAEYLIQETKGGTMTIDQVLELRPELSRDEAYQIAEDVSARKLDDAQNPHDTPLITTIINAMLERQRQFVASLDALAKRGNIHAKLLASLNDSLSLITERVAELERLAALRDVTIGKHYDMLSDQDARIDELAGLDVTEAHN